MKRQVDFDVRVFKLTPSGTEAGATTHENMRKFIKETYLDNGWEVVSTFGAPPEIGTVPVAVALAKYEDVDTESVKKKSSG